MGGETVQAKAQEKTVIAVAVDRQTATQGGQEVGYPITLTNAGSESKTYTVAADGAAWASFRVAPSNVMVIGAGESKAFTAFAKANDNAPVGQQTFTLTISSNDKVLKQLPLSVDVQKASGGASQLKGGLEIGLVVIVILIVIVGLIFGFSKLRGNEGEETDEKTYY